MLHFMKLGLKRKWPFWISLPPQKEFRNQKLNCSIATNCSLHRWFGDDRLSGFGNIASKANNNKHKNNNRIKDRHNISRTLFATLEGARLTKRVCRPTWGRLTLMNSTNMCWKMNQKTSSSVTWIGYGRGERRDVEGTQTDLTLGARLSLHTGRPMSLNLDICLESRGTGSTGITWRPARLSFGREAPVWSRVLTVDDVCRATVARSVVVDCPTTPDSLEPVSCRTSSDILVLHQLLTV